MLVASISSLRRGFTLVEVLMALILALLVTGAIVTLLTRQERFYRGVHEMLDVRERVRDAGEILVADLRSSAVAEDTLRLTADTAVELFTSLGASTVCSIPAANRIALPPDTLQSGALLTAWLTTPDTGDLVLVFHDSSTATPIRGWLRFRIAAVSRRSAALTCPPTTGFTTTADINAGARAYDITLASTIPPEVLVGAPVRIVRRGRYSVYRSSGQWYLGYRRCDAISASATAGASICGTIQPLSGPYHGSTSSGGAAPISLRYYLRDGSQYLGLGPATGVSRIDIIARGQSAQILYVPGLPSAVYTDSAVAAVALRNFQ